MVVQIISHITNKLHSTRPHDLTKKIMDSSKLCKSFGIGIVETNNYLKDLCGFYGFPFIDNSNITENY